MLFGERELEEHDQAIGKFEMFHSVVVLLILFLVKTAIQASYIVRFVTEGDRRSRVSLGHFEQE